MPPVVEERFRPSRGGPARAFRTSLSRASIALSILGLFYGGPAQASSGCSLSGGAPWREYQSKHFVLDVAGWTGDPGHLVSAFEQLRAAVLAALIVEEVEIPGKVRVILLPHRRGLVDYAGSSNVLGLFWSTPLGEPTILTSADQVDDMPQVIAHELTHYLSYYLFPRQPYWFAEGLAQFLEGVAKVDRKGRRFAGGDPMNGWVAGSVKIPHMQDLVPALQPEMYTDPFVSSWILYRFLWNERGPQLSGYQQDLMDGVAPADAWNAAFPEWSFAGGKINLLDGKLAHYQLTGRGDRWEVKVSDVDDSYKEVDAPLGDIHVTLLSLRLTSANPLDHDRLRREAMEEAEREDPGNPLVGAERVRGAERLPALREIVLRRPNDGRGWYLLGQESPDAEEREAALRKAVALWPGGAFAQAALAAHLAATGRAREGLPFANLGVELAPWSPTAVSTLASVALGLGKCREALTLQTRAVETVEARRIGSLDANLAALRSALAAMRAHCADASSAR